MPHVGLRAAHVLSWCAARSELGAAHVRSTCDASGAYARARRGANAPWPLGWTRPLGQPTLPTCVTAGSELIRISVARAAPAATAPLSFLATPCTHTATDRAIDYSSRDPRPRSSHHRTPHRRASPSATPSAWPRPRTRPPSASDQSPADDTLSKAQG